MNLKEALEYELSAVPFSIAYPDGSLPKGNNTTLLLELEKETVVSEKLPSSEEQESTWIIDGMVILQMLKFSSCTIFGKLSDKLNYLKWLYNLCSNIMTVKSNVIFDFYQFGKSDGI